jgi:hypothetical protein
MCVFYFQYPLIQQSGYYDDHLVYLSSKINENSMHRNGTRHDHMFIHLPEEVAHNFIRDAISNGYWYLLKFLLQVCFLTQYYNAKCTSSFREIVLIALTKSCFKQDLLFYKHWQSIRLWIVLNHLEICFHCDWHLQVSAN